MILAGNVALEEMGFKTYGLLAGVQMIGNPILVVGAQELEMLAYNREGKGKLKRPLVRRTWDLFTSILRVPKGSPIQRAQLGIFACYFRSDGHER